MDPATIIISVIKIALEIHRQVNLAESNKKKLKSLANTMQQVVEALQGLSSLPRQNNFITALKSMEACLQDIQIFISAFSKAGRMMRLVNAGNNEKQMEDFKTRILEHLPLLNIGLTAELLVDREQDRRDEEEDRRFLMQQQEQALREIQAARLGPEDLEAIVRKQLESFADRFEQQFHQVASPTSPLLPRDMIVNLSDVMFERRLGESQFGTIYHGTWRHQPVTIKWVEHLTTEDERQLFIREAQVMSRLRNEHITPFYGACIENHRMCLVMGVMEKGDLGSVLTTLTLPERLTMAKELSLGLAYLHDQGVIHGDIHPQTIGVNRYNQAKWTEFGLVKTRSRSIASIMTVSQEIRYQAPESWQRRATLSEASDIYSFGVLLWTLMTGRLPHASLRREDIMARVKQGYREPIPSDVPPECAALIEACWSTEVSRRPRAMDLARSLQAINLAPPRPISPTGEEYYAQGVNAENDHAMEEAYRLYERAAQKDGYMKAFTRLGLFKLEGLGGQAINKREAREHLEKGAEKGHVLAMFNLARMHEKGQTETGTPYYPKALFWYQEVLKRDPEDTRAQEKVAALKLLLNTKDSGYAMQSRK